MSTRLTNARASLRSGRRPGLVCPYGGSVDPASDRRRERRQGRHSARLALHRWADAGEDPYHKTRGQGRCRWVADLVALLGFDGGR